MRLTAPRTPAPGGGVEPAVRYDFLSSDEFRGMGGVLMPAATPPVCDHGLVLNGVDQYATIPLANYVQAFQGGVQDEVSIYCEFFPDFNYTDAVWRTVWDCGGGVNRYLVQKDPANPYNLYFYAGATTIISTVSSAVYGLLWFVSGRNRMLAALKSGANALYLNGVQIGASAAAWSKLLPASLLVGSGPASAFFDGTITDFGVYSRQLTNAEAIEMTTLD